MIKTRILEALRWLVYAAVIAVPLVFFRYSMFPFGIPKIMLFQALVELMAALWVVLIVLDRRYLPKPNLVFLAVIAFAAILLLSGIFGADHFRSFWSTIDRALGIVGIFHFLLFAVILMGLGPEVPWRKVFTSSALVGGIVGLSVLLSKWGLWSFFLRQSVSRPGGIFGNALFVGQYMLWNIFIAGWLFSKERRPAWRAALGVSIALQVFAVFLAQTIGIILGLAAGMACLLVAGAVFERGRLRKISAGLLLLGVVAAGAVFMSRHSAFWGKVPGMSRVASISKGQSDVHDRLLAWQTAWSGFKERPLLGWGWENAYIPFNNHYDPKLLVTTIEGTFFDKPHNVYLEELVTGGVLGLLGYLGIFAALAAALVRHARRGPEERREAYFLGSAVAAYLLQNAIAFDTVGTYLMLALLLGYAGRRPEEPAPAVESEPAWARPVLAAALIAALIPVWFLNINTARAANRYYWGINYFLNGLPEASDLAWHQVLGLTTPYKDYIKKDYANVLMQGFQQDMRFPNFDDKVKEGAAYLEEISAHHPKDYFFQVATADYYVTFVAFNRGEYLEKAGEHLARARELSPRRQQIYYVAARRDLMQGDTEAALGEFRAAIDLNPEAGDPHFTYGMLLYGLGRPQEGAAEIKKAAELGRLPKSIDEAVKLASFEADMSHDYPAAIQNLKLALALGANLPQNGAKMTEIHFKLGVAYYLAGDTANAKAELQIVSQNVDITKAQNWEALKPVLDELGVKYGK